MDAQRAGEDAGDLINSTAIPPPEVIAVSSEALQLPAEAPLRWFRGTALNALKGGSAVPAPGALMPDSVTVAFDGRTLSEGDDYLLDPRWGTLGIAPGSSLSPVDVVRVDYSYSLARLDSIVLRSGRVEYILGASRLTTPLPPASSALETGGLAVANIFVRHDGRGPVIDVFPIAERVEEVVTGTTQGRLHRTLGKLRRGELTTIVCWGDSVTVGGDASPGNRYVEMFERRLQRLFPDAPLAVETVAVGGSNSLHWLHPSNYPHPVAEWRPRCDWRRIAELRPDLVTIEFVNDAGLNAAQAWTNYREILGRLEDLGAEVILITPHFTEPEMMGFRSLREPDSRPYVRLLHELADTYGVALADVSARWGSLWRAGIPYTTLLANGINHPDDRGHALFADELIRCFT